MRQAVKFALDFWMMIGAMLTAGGLIGLSGMALTVCINKFFLSFGVCDASQIASWPTAKEWATVAVLAISGGIWLEISFRAKRYIATLDDEWRRLLYPTPSES